MSHFLAHRILVFAESKETFELTLSDKIHSSLIKVIEFAQLVNINKKIHPFPCSRDEWFHDK